MAEKSGATNHVRADRERNLNNATANSADPDTRMAHIKVAAGILLDAAGSVLISERLCDGPFNGLWEFPGGKIAPGETAEQALSRELAEEIGVEVTAISPFMSLRHEYSDRTVEIEFFLISDWQSEPVGREGQRLRWVDVNHLDASELLPADVPVVEAINKLRRNPVSD